MTAKSKIRLTRSERAAMWIQEFCRVPSGAHKGDRVRLTRAQKQTLADIYDHDDAPRTVTVDNDMGAFIALLHTVGPEAPQGGSPDTLPAVSTDPWSLWSAVGPKLQDYITRDGAGAIYCTGLGTRYPRRAA